MNAHRPISSKMVNDCRGSALLLSMATLLGLTLVAFSIGRYKESTLVPLRKARVVSLMNEIQARVLSEVQKPKYYLNCGPASFRPTSPPTESRCGLSDALSAALGLFQRRPLGVPCPANDGSCFIKAELSGLGEIPPPASVDPAGIRMDLEASVVGASSRALTFVLSGTPAKISKLFVHVTIVAPSGLSGAVVSNRVLTLEVPQEVFTSQSGLCTGAKELFAGFDGQNQPICRAFADCPTGESFKGLRANSTGLEPICHRLLAPAPGGAAGDPPQRCRPLSSAGGPGVTADGKALCCTGNQLITGVTLSASNQYVPIC